MRITSIRFSKYKAFSNYSVSLGPFNVLVGPNNSGKSTIIGAFRLLAEGLRMARAKKPSLVIGPNGRAYGYEINLSRIPIATENVYYNYEEDSPTRIVFRISNGSFLHLNFPERGACNLTWETDKAKIRSPQSFNKVFDINIGLVPVLGPVEHKEKLFGLKAAREALLTHRASRNFRNIWHHYPDRFDEFKSLIRATWPGMDIEKPEIDRSLEQTLLYMFCPEERFPREIFWAGFGFQVWCQMLTFIILNQTASLFIIDEPDIYLHSDLQRQLLSILRNLGPDILLATHSTEMITEANTDEILLVNKKYKSSKRINDPSKLQPVFNLLGSNFNPILTQIARTKKIVYVEGKDFQILSRFASILDFEDVSNRSNFAVIATKGYNPERAKMITKGIQEALGAV